MKYLIFSLSLFFLTFLASCKKDPCKNIVCENGGICVNGTCDCPEGYEGPSCGDQVTPDVIRLSSIKVTSFPPTDNGAGWDLTSGADIYVVLSKGNTVLFNSSTYYQNASETQTYDFNVNGWIDLDDPNSTYNIRLFDYDDFDADDFMGGYNFVPYSSTNGFPSTLALGNGQLVFELEISYTF